MCKWIDRGKEIETEIKEKMALNSDCLKKIINSFDWIHFNHINDAIIRTVFSENVIFSEKKVYSSYYVKNKRK